MSGADPVSWLVIERGWAVESSDGADLGQIDELLGDTERDIFDGLIVSPGRLRPSRYVPAECVARIVMGSVTLSLGSSEFDRLEERKVESPPG